MTADNPSDTTATPQQLEALPKLRLRVVNWVEQEADAVKIIAGEIALVDEAPNLILDGHFHSRAYIKNPFHGVLILTRRLFFLLDRGRSSVARTNCAGVPPQILAPHGQTHLHNRRSHQTPKRSSSKHSTTQHSTAPTPTPISKARLTTTYRATS